MKHISPEAFVNAVPLEEKQFTLKDLSNLLRDPSQWPEGFVWDYTDAEYCAMGLVVKSVPSVRQMVNGNNNGGVYLNNYLHTMADYFGMPLWAARKIFYRAGENARFGILDIQMEKVKPQRVAKLIDKYLAETA